MNKNSIESSLLLAKAIRLASSLHEHQTDKSGRPFILHPTNVMLNCSPIDSIMMVAILHDVVEKCNFGIEEIKKLDFPEYVCEGIKAITRGVINNETREIEFRLAEQGEKKEPYSDYIKRVIKHPIACIVKMKDIEDNTRAKRLEKLDHNTNAPIIERYRQAQIILYKPYTEACLEYYGKLI